MPIIGNGDIFTSQLADQMHRETGCDGFMIARAAIHNPWVFRSFTGSNSVDINLSGAVNDSYTPKLEEIEKAEQEYLSYVHANGDDNNADKKINDSQQTGVKVFRTKPKYLAFHQQNFARMKQQLSATSSSQPHTQTTRNHQQQQQQMMIFPNTIHLQ